MNYSNPFDNTDFSSYDADTFGNSIRERRKELGLSLRYVAKKIGISPLDLGDIERCHKPAPSIVASGVDFISILVQELNLTESQKDVLEKMAQYSRLGRIKSVEKFITENPLALEFILKAMEKNLTDEQWRCLIGNVNEI